MQRDERRHIAYGTYLCRRIIAAHPEVWPFVERRWAELTKPYLENRIAGRGRYVQALHVLGEIKDTIACDISKARADLGYEPKTGLVAGMRASVRWCVERGERI